MIDLNTFPLPHDYDGSCRPSDAISIEVADNSTVDGQIEVYFRDLPENLCQEIQNAKHVLGCVAWLTHPDVLDALSRVSCTSSFRRKTFSGDRRATADCARRTIAS